MTTTAKDTECAELIVNSRCTLERASWLISQRVAEETGGLMEALRNAHYNLVVGLNHVKKCQGDKTRHLLDALKCIEGALHRLAKDKRQENLI